MIEVIIIGLLLGFIIVRELIRWKKEIDLIDRALPSNYKDVQIQEIRKVIREELTQKKANRKRKREEIEKTIDEKNDNKVIPW